MDRLNGRPVLVTGAAGFVGPHLARALAEHGAHVHGCGLGSPPADLPLESWTQLDLADEPALLEVCARIAPAAIVHLAGQSSAAASFEDPAGTFRANVAGTRNLLEAVRAAIPRARVIVVGTSEIYGSSAPGIRTSESAALAPLSPYALSKAAADQVAAAFGVAHGLDVVRARPFGHTGPGQTARFAIPAWAEQIAAIEAGRADPVLRVGNLDVTRDLSDVRDIVRGYVRMLEAGRPGAAYNVCRGEGVHLDAIVARLVALAEVPVTVEVDLARLRPADVPYLVGDPSRMAEECGWSAEMPLELTLADVLAEWRARLGAAHDGGK